MFKYAFGALFVPLVLFAVFNRLTSDAFSGRSHGKADVIPLRSWYISPFDNCFPDLGTGVLSLPIKLAVHYNTMCSYRTLYHNDKHGYVIYGEGCRHLQLGFGCVLINFQRDEFNGFRRVVTEIVGEYEGMTLSASKSITIPTPCDGLSLYLSAEEINILHAMIEEADTNLSVKDLMRLF